MATLTPYRLLPVERRLALLTYDLQHNPESRSEYAQRLARNGGGFRTSKVRKWPVEQLAREIVRRRLEGPAEELGLLQLLYVELEPEIQITFLNAAGVEHQQGVIDPEMAPPFADADAVRKGVAAVREQHGEAAEHYLQTIALYSSDAWPGIEER